MKVSRHVEIQLDKFKAEDEEERCGVIIREPLSFIEVPNRHPDSEHRFSIRAGDVRALLSVRPGVVLLGFFHTHPGDGSMRRPSTRDLHVANKLRQYVHAMYHPLSRTLVWYDHTGVVAEEHIRYRIKGVTL